MKYWEANRALVEAIPETNLGYRKHKMLFWPDEPGPTVVYEDVLKPLLVSLARDNQTADLKRVLNFLEMLSVNEDSDVRDLVVYTVYDLCLDDAAFKVAKHHMGRGTRRICRRVIREEIK